MSKCKAKTQKGKPCKNPAIDGSNYCRLEAHQNYVPKPNLTVKQKRFIEEYCTHHNASKAAINAGYSEKTAGEQGYQMLHKTSISQAIKNRMQDLSMSADEAIKLLADYGRGNLNPFMRWDDKTGSYQLDFSTPEAQANIHLIREIKQNDVFQKKKQRKTVDGVQMEVEVNEVIGRNYEIKLHDSKDAINKILKVHGAYAAQKLEHAGADGEPLPPSQQVVIYVPDNKRGDRKQTPGSDEEADGS